MDGLMINMWLMLIYSNYLNFTTFRTSESTRGFILNEFIAFLPWIISVILVIIK